MENITNDLVDLIEMCSPELREITFHTDGSVIAKTGGRAKYPKKLYAARQEGLHKKADLVVKALQKLYIENIAFPLGDNQQ